MYICQSQSPKSSRSLLSPYLPYPACPHMCFLHLCLNSCPWNRFICTIFLGSTYAGQYIFVFLYDLLQSVEQTLGPSTSISFLQWLSNIPLYICTSLKSPQGQQCDVWKGGRKTLGWWVSELTFCLPYLPMAYAELWAAELCRTMSSRTVVPCFSPS